MCSPVLKHASEGALYTRRCKHRSTLTVAIYMSCAPFVRVGALPPILCTRYLAKCLSHYGIYTSLVDSQLMAKSTMRPFPTSRPLSTGTSKIRGLCHLPASFCSSLLGIWKKCLSMRKASVRRRGLISGARRSSFTMHQCGVARVARLP